MRQEKSQRSTPNYWKWAFVLVVLLLLATFLYLLYQTRPIATDENTTTPQNVNPAINEPYRLSTSIEKEDAEGLLNTTLQSFLTDDDNTLYLTLNNQAELHGTIAFLGFDVPFSINIVPSVLSDGNLQFYAVSTEIAHINLSVSRLLSLLAKQVDFPDYVSFDTKAQTISINLQTLLKNYPFEIRLTAIDLEAATEQIRFDLFIDPQMISDSIATYQSTNE